MCKEVKEYLSVFWEKKEEEQRAFILDYLLLNKNTMDCGKFFCEYKVNGETVCKKFGWKYYGTIIWRWDITKLLTNTEYFDLLNIIMKFINY